MVHDFADLGVDVGNRGEVAVSQQAGIIGVELPIIGMLTVIEVCIAAKFPHVVECHGWSTQWGHVEFRQLNGFSAVEIPVFLGDTEGQVWTIVAKPEEEGLVPARQLTEFVDGHIGLCSIIVSIIRHIRHFRGIGLEIPHAERVDKLLSVPFSRNGGFSLLQILEVMIVEINGVWIVRETLDGQTWFRPGDRIGFVVVINLSNGSGVVTIGHEVLRQSYDVRVGRPKVSIQSPDTQFIRPFAGEHTGPRRIAHCDLHIAFFEVIAHPGKPVDVRTDDVFTTIATQFRPKVVSEDEKNVGFVRHP